MQYLRQCGRGEEGGGGGEEAGREGWYLGIALGRKAWHKEEEG